jgi:hypothetical protein
MAWYRNSFTFSYNGPGYNEQNLAVYDCEFVKILRHYGGNVVGKLFKLKRTQI